MSYTYEVFPRIAKKKKRQEAQSISFFTVSLQKLQT